MFINKFYEKITRISNANITLAQHFIKNFFQSTYTRHRVLFFFTMKSYEKQTTTKSGIPPTRLISLSLLFLDFYLNAVRMYLKKLKYPRHYDKPLLSS